MSEKVADDELWADLKTTGAITPDMDKLYRAFDWIESTYDTRSPEVTFEGDQLSVVGTLQEMEYQVEICWSLVDRPGKVEADGSRWVRKAFKLCGFSLQKHQQIVSVDNDIVEDAWSDEVWFTSPAKVARAVLLGDDRALARWALAKLDKFPWYLPAVEGQWVEVDEPQWRVVLFRGAQPMLNGVVKRRSALITKTPVERENQQRLGRITDLAFDSLDAAEVAVAEARAHLAEGETVEIETCRITQRAAVDGRVTDQSPWRPLGWAEPVADPEIEPEVPLNEIKLPTKGVPGHKGAYWRWERRDGAATMIIVSPDDGGGWTVQAIPDWSGKPSWEDIIRTAEIVEVRVPTKRAALEAGHQRFGGQS